MNTSPPHWLRSFSRWPRYPRVAPEKENEEENKEKKEVPRVAISENLSLDQVMTEFMLRVHVTHFLMKYMPMDSDDPAKGLTFDMKKLNYELSYSRGNTECKRDSLDIFYQGLDLHTVKAFINKDEHRVEGFLFCSDHITMRRLTPKSVSERLSAWLENGRRKLDDDVGSDSSDDDGYKVFIPDNCQKIFVYGLKLLWTIENRDVVWSFVSGITQAFEPPKPSPPCQYTQKKTLEENQKESYPETHQGEMSTSSAGPGVSSSQPIEMAGAIKIEKSYDRVGKAETSESEEEGILHFMVNVIKPQFNLHSEEANGRFLLAAGGGRVLAKSFHSILCAGVEVIKQPHGIGCVQIPNYSPETLRTRMELSAMLDEVQAYVAPTDVDPCAGLQWLPKIHRNFSRVKRTGVLLESVFLPCDMYIRYTKHNGGISGLKVKPLRELSFNSGVIQATMTSRQFQVMLDVLNNLLFARLPKPRKSSLQCPPEDGDVEEEADEVVPDGVEEVELAKINLREKERERKLLLDDIRKLSHCFEIIEDTLVDKEGDLWMISNKRSILVQGLEKELLYAQMFIKSASASLRMALQNAAQLRLMEKEKNKSPSYATCISLQIKMFVWSMLKDGRSFAEAVISDMIYNFDRDYQDIGVARFSTKYFIFRNCSPNANSDTLISAWNPPPEWGNKKFMLCVDAKQGAIKDGYYPLELFHVELYPLRINFTETIYRMMYEYFFPNEEQDSERPQKFKEKKAGKSQEDKYSRPTKRLMCCNIKINQVELLVSYESSRYIVNDFKLLMDTYHRAEFTGTRRKLFSRVKSHMKWGVVKTLFGMQRRKFKRRSQNDHESSDSDLNESDNVESGKAGDSFVASVRGLFSTQRRKVWRAMRGKAKNGFHGDSNESDEEFSPSARQKTIARAKRLVRRHNKKFRPRIQRGSSSKIPNTENHFQ